MRFLADECCPKAIVERLRADGHDVRYAAETDRSAADADLLAIAFAERRIVITEDFDFGELLIRDRRPSTGAVILFLPKLKPEERAERLAIALSASNFDFEGAISVVEARRIRQRRFGA